MITVLTPFLCDQMLQPRIISISCMTVLLMYSDVWEFHSNAPNIETCASKSLIFSGDKLAWVFIVKLLAQILGKISASLLAGAREMILNTPSSQYLLTCLVRTSTCFVLLVVLMFCEMKIVSILSTRTVIGRFTLISKIFSGVEDIL